MFFRFFGDFLTTSLPKKALQKPVLGVFKKSCKNSFLILLATFDFFRSGYFFCKPLKIGVEAVFMIGYKEITRLFGAKLRFFSQNIRLFLLI